MAFPSPFGVTRRVLLRGAAAACVASITGCASRGEAPAPAGPSQLRLVGETILPYKHCANRPAFVIAEGATYDDAIVNAKAGVAALAIRTK